jgi:hypothetical protein
MKANCRTRVDFARNPKYPPVPRRAWGLAHVERVNGMKSDICATAAAAPFVPYETGLAASALEELPA